MAYGQKSVSVIKGGQRHINAIGVLLELFEFTAAGIPPVASRMKWRIRSNKHEDKNKCCIVMLEV